MNKDFLEAFTTVEQIKSFLDWEKGLREEIAKKFETKAKETYYDEQEIWLEAAVIARGNCD